MASLQSCWSHPRARVHNESKTHDPHYTEMYATPSVRRLYATPSQGEKAGVPSNSDPARRVDARKGEGHVLHLDTLGGAPPDREAVAVQDQAGDLGGPGAS